VDGEVVRRGRGSRQSAGCWVVRGVYSRIGRFLVFFSVDTSSFELAQRC